jgi:uncharacterized membrane protein YfcA
VVAQAGASVVGFRREGVSELGVAARFLPAVMLGSVCGALLAAHAPDALFQRAFGVLMLAFLPVLLRSPRPRQGLERRVPALLQHAAFGVMGLYGGAFQAGLGIPLLLALVGLAGLDLVRGNAAKVSINVAQQALALLVFALSGKVVWAFGLILALGSAIGGYVASRLAARIGPRLIRPILALAVVALALWLLLR